MRFALTNSRLKKMLVNNYAVACIILGIALVSLSIGPYQNPDTEWEYKAATGVILWGMPYVEVEGSLINQPPLGFYSQGLFLSVFGLSMETGAFLVTLFGLGCTLLVYKIGETLYGKQTGLFASALFALTPWQLILSRSFLIDTQCLFFSLFCFYTAILAIHSGSNKLYALSGLLFALALLTKFYAVFILIPLSLFYLCFQHKKIRQLPWKLVAFCLPTLLLTLLWLFVHDWMMPYYLPKGLGYMFEHSDFSDLNPAGTVPSYSFISTFLLNYGLGLFFTVLFLFSLLFGFVFWKKLGKQVTFDLIFSAGILFILALNMYLAVILNLKVPYTSTVKYTYQALPFFSLVAASLAVKFASVLQSTKSLSEIKKKALIFAGVIGAFLFASSIIANMFSAHQLSTASFVIFQVEPGKLLGYSFDNFYAIKSGSLLMNVQLLGFGFVLSGILLGIRQSKTMHHKRRV